MPTRNSSGKNNSKSRPEDVSLAARTGRTLTQRPYTSAAIATGAITAVAAAAAGAFFFSRRDKSIRENSADLRSLVKDGIADATSRAKELVGVGGGSEADGQNGGRSQQEIAEEALALKESGSGAAISTPTSSSAEQSKVGSIAY